MTIKAPEMDSGINKLPEQDSSTALGTSSVESEEIVAIHGTSPLKREFMAAIVRGEIKGDADDADTIRKPAFAGVPLYETVDSDA